ncbi:carbohydrate ABC transporter permease [Shouchella lehensis]|uniref:Sugar ABC transporter permease n=1 Tax=Shouchella lehensis TaxID=300825 RepID=A0A4Y7WEV3_9BACI|nr:sugar ABC transporter permease [Shouchella lehensis]MBG9784891.1 spermidine/putrescine ABC transporter permease [Shouchella lehensis]RQW18586.1 sugar ABC transporter permease [Bacillus sp. C1-1]TES46306.1 sugar ABC transporter permease [Shouchella lehensis]
MAETVQASPSKLTLFLRDYGWCYVFILVPILVFLLFTFIPVIYAFIMSFQQYHVMGSTFIGLENYQTMVQDEIFWRSMRNTFVFTVATVPVSVGITLVLAVLIFPRGKKVQTFFKASLYLPTVASGVTMALVWFWIYDPTNMGLLNMILSFIGMENTMWLGSRSTALFSLILMSWLTGHGAGIILYLAALGGIPKSLYEAADIDHASGWSQFKNITMPLLKPTTLYLLVMGIIGSFQVFMSIYLMTQGGPNFATTTIAYLIYVHAFEYYQFGLAAAESFALGIVIILASVFQFKLMSSDVEF